MIREFITAKIGGLDTASVLTILGFLGSCLAAGGAAVVAVGRYIRSATQEQAARKRAKALKAADEIDDFYEHHSVWLATRIIDYQNLTIDKSDLDCLERSMAAEDVWNCLVHHADPDFTAARTGSGAVPVFFHDQRRIRDLFDRFLTKLERIEKLIASDIISKDDFGDFFSYWLQLMSEIPLKGDRANHLSNDRRKRLWKYIRNYEYNGVVRLFAMYQRAEPVGTAADKAFKNRIDKNGEDQPKLVDRYGTKPPVPKAE